MLFLSQLFCNSFLRKKVMPLVTLGKHNLFVTNIIIEIKSLLISIYAAIQDAM